MTEESIFITGDSAFSKKKQTVISETDRKILKTVKTGEGAIPIKSVEEINELVEAASETLELFRQMVTPMTRDQARVVRKLRVDEGYSWRVVAQVCHSMGWGNWQPPSNQLAGMAICEKAADYFDEDYEAPPWN